MGRPGAVALETQWLVGLPGVGRPAAEKPMSEAKTSAAESGRVVLTAASLITAIMIERLVGRLGELSDGQVLWGSTSGVLVQSTLVVVLCQNSADPKRQ